jgi:uncharacterized membrane protein YphA (DoxX/SURF4 family)
MTILKTIERLFIRTQTLDFLPLLAIRLYLIPIFYEGAHAKLTGFGALVEWFGAPASQGGLHMPAPLLMAVLATATETAGCICLALGLFTRLISVPLMVTMTVAGLSVHWSHGWAAIAGKTAESTLRFQAFMEWLAQNFPAGSTISPNWETRSSSTTGSSSQSPMSSCSPCCSFAAAGAGSAWTTGWRAGR